MRGGRGRHVVTVCGLPFGHGAHPLGNADSRVALLRAPPVGLGSGRGAAGQAMA
jgi:hypothetical protein